MFQPLRARRTCGALLTLCFLIAGCAYPTAPGASTVASSREAAARSASRVPPLHYGLQVAPGTDGATSSIPWLELRGRVGTTELFEGDVVIALDLSSSAHFPSGLDLDEDGIVGELMGVVRNSSQEAPPSIPPRHWTTDADDTIVEMELAAARAIIRGLAQRRNRIGLLTYMTGGRVRSEVGEPSAALAAVDRLSVPGAWTGTNVSAALRRAHRMLTRAPEQEGFPRSRAIMLFTDGRPTDPQNQFLARITAIDYSARLAKEGIELYVFSYGELGVPEAKFLLDLAGTAAGRIYRVGRPARLLEDLPPVDLTPRWLRIENASTEAPAVAIETRPDGHFSAFVPLAPGANHIRVLAELGNGKLQRWVGDVVYEPGEENEAQRAALAQVLGEIERRSGESDAAAGPPDAD